MALVFNFVQSSVMTKVHLKYTSFLQIVRYFRTLNKRSSFLIKDVIMSITNYLLDLVALRSKGYSELGCTLFNVDSIGFNDLYLSYKTASVVVVKLYVDYCRLREGFCIVR